MNREIKFRIWDHEKKQFLTYPCYVNHLDGNEFTCFDRYFTVSEERCVLQQYTGLQDKRGQDVYEGDIIRYTFKQDEHGDLFTWVSQVVFENQAFGTKDDIFFNWTSKPFWSCEVIGNIFETPELLII